MKMENATDQSTSIQELSITGFVIDINKSNVASLVFQSKLDQLVGKVVKQRATGVLNAGSQCDCQLLILQIKSPIIVLIVSYSIM
jgi:hypothetical protein